MIDKRVICRVFPFAICFSPNNLVSLNFLLVELSTACSVVKLGRHVTLITPLAMLFASNYLSAGAIESLLSLQ